MKKNYFRKSSKIFITAGFLALLSINANAQTTEEKKSLRTKTNFSILAEAQSEANRIIVSDERLRNFASDNDVPYRIEDESGKIMQLVAIDGSGNPIYLITDNDKAAITSGVNLIATGGSTGYNLTGKDVKILEWDGGRVRGTHQELAGKITVGTDLGTITTTNSDHSTHVAGTILATGVDKKAKGMAPDARIISYDFNNTFNELNASLGTQEGLLSTHSYGYSAGWTYNSATSQYTWGGDTNVSSTIDYKFGYYSEYDAIVDEMLKAAPWHTYVRSAGNHRGEGPASRPGGQELDGGTTGFDSVSFGSLSKNVIIIGAVEPVTNYVNPSSVVMTSFSSYGPTDDGRIVPTVVADGSNLYSTYSTSDTAYGTMSGTSMATPATTGAISLLQDFAKKKTGKYFSAPLVKSIVTNTAKEAGNAGPDYTYGFGLIDAKAAVETIDYKGKASEYREGNLTNGEVVTLKFKTQAGRPFKATLAWNDRPGVPKAYVGATTPKDPSFLNDRTPKLIDDLDLRVELNGKNYLPYTLDPANPGNVATTGDNIVDNIEQIYIENPETGTLTLTFTSKRPLEANGVDYGLAVSGMAVDKDLSVEAVSAQVTETNFKTGVPALATIKNTGSMDMGAFNVKFTLKDPAGTLMEQSTVPVAGLAVGASIDVNTTISLKDLFTPYSLTAEIISEEDLIAGNNKKNTTVTSTVADLREGGSVMLEDFNAASFAEHAWDVVNVVPTTPTWQLILATWTYDGSQFAISSNGGQQADDWMLTNPMILKEGSKYRVSYYTAKNSSSAARNENIEVFLGDSKTVAAMTTSLNKFTWVQTETNATFKKIEFEFTAAKTGTQYMGIRHYNNAGKSSWIAAIDNFKVLNTEVGKPTPEFTYTILDGSNTITKYTDVRMENATVSNPAVTSWNWEFIPNTVTYSNGTTATSEKPEVRFNNIGTYTVKLTATNDNGTADKTKYDYINVVAPTVAANFSIDRTTIHTQENAQFTNLTAGLPAPTAYKWTITPSEPGAFTYLEGTNATSEHLNVKFNKAGTYSVKLAATTPDGVKVAEKLNAVTVKTNTNPPLAVTATKNGSSVNIDWEKPEYKYADSFINEGFEGAAFPPTGWQIINANGDANTWKKLALTTGGYVAGVYSWTSAAGAIQTDDYLVSNVVESLPSGYNELTFNSPGDPLYPDTMAIYYVKVNDSNPLTKEQIQAGVKVFEGKTLTETSDFNKVSLGNNYDGKPFRLAFYSYNKDQFLLTVDNVKISKPGTVIQSANSTTNPEAITKQSLAYAQETSDGTVVLSTEATPKPNWPQINVGYSNNITGYEILRNGEYLASLPSSETVYIDNSISTPGNYCYNVVTIYDGVNKSDASNEACVTIDAVLSTVDVSKSSQMAAFPNPVVDVVKVKFAEKLIGKATVEVYGLDGKKVLTKTLTENELIQEGVNLSNLSTGAYILVVKDNSKTYTTKLIKK